MRITLFSNLHRMKLPQTVQRNPFPGRRRLTPGITKCHQPTARHPIGTRHIERFGHFASSGKTDLTPEEQRCPQQLSVSLQNHLFPMHVFRSETNAHIAPTRLPECPIPHIFVGNPNKVRLLVPSDMSVKKRNIEVQPVTVGN